MPTVLAKWATSRRFGYPRPPPPRHRPRRGECQHHRGGDQTFPPSPTHLRLVGLQQPVEPRSQTSGRCPARFGGTRRGTGRGWPPSSTGFVPVPSAGWRGTPRNWARAGASLARLSRDPDPEILGGQLVAVVTSRFVDRVPGRAFHLASKQVAARAATAGTACRARPAPRSTPCACTSSFAQFRPSARREWPKVTAWTVRSARCARSAGCPRRSANSTVKRLGELVGVQSGRACRPARLTRLYHVPAARPCGSPGSARPGAAGRYRRAPARGTSCPSHRLDAESSPRCHPRAARRRR